MSEESLPATTPRYRYQGVEQCLDILTKEYDRYEEGCKGNPYVIIFGVDERSFLDCAESQENFLINSAVTYNFTSNTVLLRMQPSFHSVACFAFEQIVNIWARKQKSTVDPGESKSVRGSTRGKTADISWLPSELPSSRSAKWPAVAVDVKWSELQSKLVQDMQFWLCDTPGQVKVAMTLSIHRRGDITIERWGVSPGSQDPFVSQRMKIARKVVPGHPRIQGSIDMAFEDVFLRPKQKTETDFVLTNEDMQAIARPIWRSMERRGALDPLL